MPYIYPFTLPPLPYAYDALEPYIDTQTMHCHHDRHFKGYIDNLNAVIKKHPALQKMTLSELLTADLSRLPPGDKTGIMHNAGGVYNHALFFEGLSPPCCAAHRPVGELARGIEKAFGSFEGLKEALTKQSASLFGSGWGCLAIAAGGELIILQLKNQQTALMYNAQSLLLLDVWEHAYYLKYRNERGHYLDNLWNLLTFPEL